MKNILCVRCEAAPDHEYHRLLSTSGFNVTIGSASQLMPSLRTGVLSADVVIVECNGVTREEDELLWVISRVLPGVPLIMLASDHSVEAYVKSLSMGFQEYLCMPVPNRELVQILRSLADDGTRSNLLSSVHSSRVP